MTAARPNKRPLAGLTSADRLAIIAGGGRLPSEIARHVLRNDINAIILAVAGEAGRDEGFEGLPRFEHELEELADLAAILKRHGVTHVVMAGSISRRPRLADIRWRLGLIRMVPAMVRAAARGDDAVLRFVVGLVEGAGIRVLGAHELLPELLVGPGCLTPKRPTAGDRADIAAAFAAAKAIGALDIGQAAVAIGGRAIALEGIEGTDGLLARTAQLRHHGRLAQAVGGVLAKCAKPGQELRTDLPTIGPETVRAAAVAGLSGIVLEAERTQIVDQVETLRLAAEDGIFILGVDADKDLP
jgi:DUF1009 family protein